MICEDLVEATRPWTPGPAAQTHLTVAQVIPDVEVAVRVVCVACVRGWWVVCKGLVMPQGAEHHPWQRWPFKELRAGIVGDLRRSCEATRPWTPGPPAQTHLTVARYYLRSGRFHIQMGHGQEP